MNPDYRILSVWLFSWIAVAFYGFVPLLVFAKHRMAPGKNIDLFDPDDPSLSAQLTREVKSMRQVLEALGFELLSGVFLPSVAERVKLINLTMINPQSKVGAGIYMVFVNHGPGQNWKLRQQFHSFVSRFRDGTSVATLNSKDLSAFPPRPRVLTTILPTKMSPSRLLAIHQCLQRRHTSQPPYSRIEEEFGGDVLKGFCGLIAEEFSDYVNAGYLSSPHDGVYRFTLKGAFLVMWKKYWPWGWIRALQARANERQLLHEFAAELPREDD